MFFSLPYFGEAAAFTSAVLWSFAVILYRISGDEVHPYALNLYKTTLTLALFPPTLLLLGQALLPAYGANVYLLMLASGALGIGISDSLFFASLNRIGAGMMAIAETLYSPFIVTLSLLFLSETLSPLQGIGVAGIVAAVLLASLQPGKVPRSRVNLLSGILLAVAAMATLAVSIVMIKPSLGALPVVWVMGVRVFGGWVIQLVILALTPGRWRILGTLRSTRRWAAMTGGSLLGNYVALLFWLAGMKYTQASTASALNQTSSVFIFFLAAVLLREQLSRRAGFALALAMIGAMMVTFG